MFYIAAGLYVFLIISISYFFSKKETTEDFIIGARGVSAVPLAISLSTSWLGGGALALILYFVFNDLPAYLFLALGAVTNLLVFSYFVKKPYELARKNNWVTMTEMVHGIFGKKSGYFVLIFVFILFLVWLLFEIVGSGLVLSNVTALTYNQSVFLISIVIGLYLLFGGFKSLIRTDLIQSGLLIFVFISCLYLTKDAPDIDYKSYVVDKPGLSWKGFIAGFFGFFALQFSESTVWQRVLAAKSAEHAQKALVYTSAFYIVTYGLIIYLIILGGSLFQDTQDEKLFSFIAYETLPSWLGSLFLVSILCIIMSTVDTILFIAAQCLSTDLGHLLGKKIDKPRMLMRLSIFILMGAVLGLSLLTRDVTAVFWFLIALWVALSPLVYMLLPVRKPTDNSIFCSMIVITLGVLLLYVLELYQDYYVAYFFFMGLALPPLLDKFVFSKSRY